MNNGIYAVVKKYANCLSCEKENSCDPLKCEDDGFRDWSFKPNDHYGIYDKMMEITGDDHEISSDAASWCELACVGEIHEFCEGEIEIVEID